MWANIHSYTELHLPGKLIPSVYKSRQLAMMGYMFVEDYLENPNVNPGRLRIPNVKYMRVAYKHIKVQISVTKNLLKNLA